MKSIMTKTILPLIAIGLWMAVCIPIASRPEGFNYFMFWVIAGIPFGIRYMFFKLMPKGYGISGTIGAIALNIIIGGILSLIYNYYTILLACCQVFFKSYFFNRSAPGRYFTAVKR